MADLDLITEIHTDVKYIKEKLSDHIANDEKVQRDYIRPLWEKHQRNKGATGLAITMITAVSGFIGGLVEHFYGAPHP